MIAPKEVLAAVLVVLEESLESVKANPAAADEVLEDLQITFEGMYQAAASGRLEAWLEGLREGRASLRSTQ